MRGNTINVDIDALNILVTGLSNENLAQLEQSLFKCVEKLSFRNHCSPYAIMKHSRSYQQSVILPLCKEFQYGKVNTETPCLVISTGYRYSIDEKLLIQLKGFPLTRYHYDVARFWFKYLTRKCNKRQGFTPLFSISMFHLATDFFRPLGSIGVELRGSKKSAFYVENGSLTGVGIGSLRSTVRVTAYSRNEKLLRSGRPSAPSLNKPCTRIEKKVKLKNATCWEELISLVDKHIALDNLFIYDLDKLFTSTQLDFRLLNCIKNLGAHQVIAAQQSDNERRKLRRLMARHRIDIHSGEYSWDYGPSIKYLKHFCSPFRKWVSKRGRRTQKEFVETFLKQ
ncbi:hypothetical protein [Alteromonas macleodii]|uniref:hypothetical protein n=1 Tax=Alteromonas macleodii TaxID=28108 RepID=UPI003140396F